MANKIKWEPLFWPGEYADVSQMFMFQKQATIRGIGLLDGDEITFSMVKIKPGSLGKYCDCVFVPPVPAEIEAVQPLVCPQCDDDGLPVPIRLTVNNPVVVLDAPQNTYLMAQFKGDGLGTAAVTVALETDSRIVDAGMRGCPGSCEPTPETYYPTIQMPCGGLIYREGLQDPEATVQLLDCNGDTVGYAYPEPRDGATVEITDCDGNVIGYAVGDAADLTVTCDTERQVTITSMPGVAIESAPDVVIRTVPDLVVKSIPDVVVRSMPTLTTNTAVTGSIEVTGMPSLSGSVAITEMPALETSATVEITSAPPVAGSVAITDMPTLEANVTVAGEVTVKVAEVPRLAVGTFAQSGRLWVLYNDGTYEKIDVDSEAMIDCNGRIMGYISKDGNDSATVELQSCDGETLGFIYPEAQDEATMEVIADSAVVGYMMSPGDFVCRSNI